MFCPCWERAVDTPVWVTLTRQCLEHEEPVTEFWWQMLAFKKPPGFFGVASHMKEIEILPRKCKLTLEESCMHMAYDSQALYSTHFLVLKIKAWISMKMAQSAIKAGMFVLFIPFSQSPFLLLLIHCFYFPLTSSPPSLSWVGASYPTKIPTTQRITNEEDLRQTEETETKYRVTVTLLQFH